MAVHAKKRRFTVDEFHQMGTSGILTPEDRLELLEGEIVEMTPIGNRHATCLRRLLDLLTERLGGRALVDVQNPIRLDGTSEPQPDLVLLKRRADYYAAGPPTPEAVLLVVEVADTSATYDREVKVPLYAASCIPEVWLIDLQGAAVEVYRQPTERGYREVRRLRGGEAVAPAAFPDVVIDIGSLIG